MGDWRIHVSCLAALFSFASLPSLSVFLLWAFRTPSLAARSWRWHQLSVLVRLLVACWVVWLFCMAYPLCLHFDEITDWRFVVFLPFLSWCVLYSLPCLSILHRFGVGGCMGSSVQAWKTLGLMACSLRRWRFLAVMIVTYIHILFFLQGIRLALALLGRLVSPCGLSIDT